jgi:RHS repeat-associated protein
MAYADPDAVTQIANGLSTTTFTYDNDGNVTQKTVDGTTTTYVYDYANRLTALGVRGATTTYAYDAFGQRVLQTGTGTTYLYPFKWYSVASSTGGGAKFATSTDYVFNGDSLVATVDQQTASGNATGTAKTRYIHPDHLGSTNVVTDENGNVVQTLDSYPYGSTRISVATSTNEKRQFIGQFQDDSTLSYLNARYYDSNRGQFVNEDPTFLAIGDLNKVQQLAQDQLKLLSDPQLLNAYSYGRDNPIVSKDPLGLWALRLGVSGTIPLWGHCASAAVLAPCRRVPVRRDGNRNPVRLVAQHPPALEHRVGIPGGVRRGRDPIEIPDARIRLVLEHGLDLAPIPVRAAEARADLVLFEQACNVHKPKFTAREHLEDRAYNGRLLFVHDKGSGGRGGLAHVVITIDCRFLPIADSVPVIADSL